MRKKIQEKSKDGTLVKSSNGDATKASEPRKRGRWDQTIDDQFVPAKKAAGAATPTWNDVEKTPALAGETPGATPRTQRFVKHCIQIDRNFNNIFFIFLDFGMRLRHIYHRIWKRQLMIHEEDDGMKHRELKEEVTIHLI